MRFGVCVGFYSLNEVKLAKQAGFDYIETNFQNISKSEDPDFEAFKTALKANVIRCESANCFIPGDLPIIGTDFAREEMKSFIENGMRRGSEVGLKKVVFGSGGARRLPNGYDYADGVRELAAFLRDVVSPIGEKYGITIVIEPLRRNECNIIHTLDEGSMLAAFVNKGNIACLADLYHMWGIGDDYENIRRLKGYIRHAHLANPVKPDGSVNRAFPKSVDEFDYAGFFAALEDAGCESCSIEAGCNDFAVDVVIAGQVMNEIRNKSRV